MTINSVFATLRLIALSQRLMLFSSVLIWVSRPSMPDAAAKVTFVSSAFILGEPTGSSNLISHLYRSKRVEDQLLILGEVSPQFKGLALER